MKLLITGANGQLGRELKRILTENGSELGPIPGDYAEARVTFADVEELDIVERNEVLEFVRAGDFDVIINCAAFTNVDACETAPDKAFLANAIGPRNLAMAAERQGAKLVQVSTDYVFSGEGKIPRREWDVCDPKSVYGKSKYLGEQYVRDFCSRYFIVRTAWLYGYQGGNFVKTMMRLARANGAVKVVDDQRGSPTNAADLAHHLLKLAVTEEYGVYHCTGKGECSWFDFARAIITLSGIDAAVAPCTSAQFPSPAKRPAYSALDHAMLRCTVGDEMRDWRDALACFLRNYHEEDDRR